MKLCKRCKVALPSDSSTAHCFDCNEHRRKMKLRRQYIYKSWVYTKLGGQCVMCGINDFRVLTIDHINRDAGSDQFCWESKSTRDSRWYIRIWKHITENQRYPHDLQLLCMNCHMIKDNYEHKSFNQYCEEMVSPLLMHEFKPSPKRKSATK